MSPAAPPMPPLEGLAPDERRFASPPGIEWPRRRRWVAASGVRLAVSEWGEPEAPPLLCAHGGFDFAQTLCGFAPRLAAAGWRVVSWDQRGHGDSDHAELYAWSADLRDAMAVLDSVSAAAIPVIGHSKGGSLLLQLAQACPHRISHFVNLDGLPSRRARPDVPDHERTKLLASELADWLDHRARTATAVRKPGTLEDLARRRGRMNPRLSHEWLCFLVSVGARKDPDGWRWKIDPAMRFGGFGPWRPEWSLRRLPGLSIPMLGILAGQREPMGFETREEDLQPFLPSQVELRTYDDVGHFLHIEQPERVAADVLAFLEAEGARP